MTRRWSFFADLHLRNWRTFGGVTVAGVNARARQTLSVFQEMCLWSLEQGVTDIAGLGDTFDQSNPPPQLIAALAEEIVAVAKQGLRVHLLLGNHEMVSDEPGDHALAPLAFVPGCYVYDRPFVAGDVLFAPYRKDRVIDWLDDVLAAGKKRGARVLAGHFGVITQSTESFLVEAPDAIEISSLKTGLDRHGFDQAFVGNWHVPFHDRNIIQCGTACPHSFGETNGFLWIPIATELPERSYVRVVLDQYRYHRLQPKSQPVFWTIPLAQFDPDGERENSQPAYLRVTEVPRSKVQEVRAQLETLQARGSVQGFEIDIVGKGETALSFVVTPVQNRSELIEHYLERTFKNEPKETRRALSAKLREYGVL